MYVTENGDKLPEVIGRPEAMAAIREANGGKLPLACNFDVVKRLYWQWPSDADIPIPAPPPAHENVALTEALKSMAAAARRNYGGYIDE